MPRPTDVGVTTASSGAGSTGSLVFTLHGSAAVDDVACCYVSQERGTVMTFPAGWTVNVSVENGTLMAYAVAWKRLDASDLAGSRQFTVTRSGALARRMSGHVEHWRDAGTPVFTHSEYVSISGGATFAGVAGTSATVDAVASSHALLTARTAPWQFTLQNGSGWVDPVESKSLSTTSVNSYTQRTKRDVTATGAVAGQTYVSNNEAAFAGWVTTAVVPYQAPAVSTPQARVTVGGVWVNATPLITQAGAWVPVTLP